ncbi:hypothetical protein SARC_00177 [Sphaeroforma arctica JP610]|uniref:Uncharacterized protein n=1 Tax=Sphaeroforma arctica JP610 TaxID=667725 RepID=A0A0L0GHC8_9EUKA|nr:hypothetical protein SARC_00177 [Sphaeroforma arctica JP610]KNC87743.1 hypothetical protein SARC_00177 [Sphaeroforma arctica JP610]|eukprot:XP_014161645.1 hypothetical protein SARC_00177 [Sphaeroforma arctica JP610]
MSIHLLRTRVHRMKPFGGDPAEHTYMPKSQSRDQNTGQDRPKNETEVRGNNSQGWCEIVAYHIDQQLGLDRVPVTVGRPIALQALLDVTKSEFERDTLQRWALFSDVTNQGDAVVRGSVTEWLTGDTLTTPDGLQCTEQWQDMLESFAKHSKTSVVQDPALLKATTTLKVFDFLMLNVDRKKRGNVFLGCPPKTFTHLTSAKKLFRKGCKTLQMDNGLGLYEPACLANYHSLKEYKEALLNSSSKDIGRLYQELPSAFSCVGIEHTLTTALHNTGHRLGASLQNSLTCDPTHTYGPVLQYYDSACYVTGLNYRMQILRERLSHCAGGS